MSFSYSNNGKCCFNPEQSTYLLAPYHVILTIPIGRGDKWGIIFLLIIMLLHIWKRFIFRVYGSCLVTVHFLVKILSNHYHFHLLSLLLTYTFMDYHILSISLKSLSIKLPKSTVFSHSLFFIYLFFFFEENQRMSNFFFFLSYIHKLLGFNPIK